MCGWNKKETEVVERCMETVMQGWQIEVLGINHDIALMEYDAWQGSNLGRKQKHALHER